MPGRQRVGAGDPKREAKLPRGTSVGYVLLRYTQEEYTERERELGGVMKGRGGQRGV